MDSATANRPPVGGLFNATPGEGSTSRHEPPIYLLDGGLGTTLADEHNCVFDSSTPLWSSSLLLSSPSTLLACQTAFAAAGADILLTDTYQASFEGFAAEGCSDEGEAENRMRSAMGIARQAFVNTGREGSIALSLGAYGATMVPGQEYSGKYDQRHLSVEGLREWHRRRIDVFVSDEKAWAEIAYVAFETLPLLEEVLAVREVIGGLIEEGRNVGEWWISAVFPGDDNVLPDGSSVKDVVKAMLVERKGASRPSGVGMNCTKVSKVEGLIVEFEGAIADLIRSGEVQKWPSLVVYPDGTNEEVYNTTTQVWEVKDESGRSVTPWDKRIFDIVEKARDRGLWKAIIVGGCCKTTPKDIARLRKRIDQEKV